jgi:hypothetical protein
MGLEPVNPELGFRWESETEALGQDVEELGRALDVDLFEEFAVKAMGILLGCECVSRAVE